jgi:MoaA/NifB/PqqE/SkfB family radical SAM enzyme
MQRLGPEHVDLNLICNKIKTKRKQGFAHLTFTGGEPTLVDWLPRVLKLAKKIGYTTYITTNGFGTKSLDYCKKILPYLDQVCFSLHGHNKQLHNAHTGREDSFRFITDSLNNISNFSDSTDMFINVVVTSKNLLYLEEIINYGVAKGVSRFIISYPAPEGRALDNFSRIAFDLDRIKKHITNITRLSSEKSLMVRFFGIPLCVLGDNLIYSNDLYWDSRCTIEKTLKNNTIELQEINDHRPTRNRVKIKKCHSCIFNKFCGGIFEEYLNIYGAQAIRPMKL